MHTNPNDVYSEILKHLNIPALNAMQEEAIQKASSGNNILLLAPTGSGKTLAFLIPLVQMINASAKGVQALVVVPSRELALQIEEVFRTMKTNFKVSCCYGGHSVKIEQNSLSEAPALIVGTPGRLADHLQRGSFDASTIRLVVLDEFDKALQMGFHVQLHVIFKALSGKQQHILTSATNMETLPEFLPFSRPDVLNYLSTEKSEKLELKIIRTKSTDKVDALLKLVAGFNQESCLVFCNHRDAVERISAAFKSNNFEHGIYHGQLEQIDREKSLIRFRSGAHQVLISTDLASRGLDIPEIRHVVHYQLPHHSEEFTHRNGRTARMHAHGQAYLIVADDEKLPYYIEQDLEEVVLPRELKLPPPPAFELLYISAGKKDKISRGDIAGLFMKKGGLQASEIGLITTLDHSSYVAVKKNLVKQVLDGIKDEKLKNAKVKVAIAN